MVKLAIPSVLMFSEMWAAEVTVLMGGRLVPEEDTNENEVNVSAIAISQNLTMMVTTLLSSLLSATATRTGSFLGAGRAASARRTVVAGSFTLLALSLAVSLVLLGFRRGVARLFATEPDLIDLLAELAFPLAAYYMLQAPALGLMGCMTGCGRQWDASMWTVVAFFPIGLGASWLLGFRLGLGAMGLMLGRVVGKLAHVLSLLYLVVCRTDFRVECERARARVSKIQLRMMKGDAVQHQESNEAEGGSSSELSAVAQVDVGGAVGGEDEEGGLAVRASS